MKLKDSNISCIFVITGFPESRSTFFRKIVDKSESSETEDVNVDLDENEGEDDDDNDDEYEDVPEFENQGVKIEGKEGLYTETIRIHDRYAARPHSNKPNVDGRLE